MILVDNSQSNLVVSPNDYGANKTKSPAALNVHVGAVDNGCVILLNGDTNSSLHLSDLYVNVVNGGHQGTIGDYYGSGFKPTPSTPTVVWQTNESTTMGLAFSLNFEIRNIRSYSAGNYSTNLFFTVVPQ
ncbi:hypothetical protein IAD21_04096 [Abditibacteriota bacterium]|nr:hypothetical protein IAD21_04096 [Abditibacteriota bacterium]